MMLLIPHLLAAPAPDPGIMGGPIPMIVALIVLSYFMIFRPQQRQRKEQEKRISALQKGDQVVTTSGIYGMVHNIKERTTILKVAEATFIEFDKNAIATVLKKDSPAAVDSK